VPRRPARRSLSRQVLRQLTRHRRVVAAALLGLSVLLALSAVRPAAPPTTDVVVTTRDLPSGALVAATDVRTVAWPSRLVPGGTLAAVDGVVGRRTVGEIRAGEPVTDVRLTTPDGLAAAAGDDRVAAPVRLADASVGGLLESGALVDVIAADGQGSARVVAHGVPVLSVSATDATGDSFAGVLVVLSVESSTATELAAAAAVGPLSVALRG
jgi:pilus assembly protein CpaB